MNHNASEPRTLVISQRRFRPTICRCSQAEYEDVIASIDAVDVVSTEGRPPRLSSAARNFRSRVARKLGINVAGVARPKSIDLTRSYDLAFVVVQHPADLDILDAVPGWRERCTKAVCYIEELWVPDLKYAKMLQPLKQFDLVLSNCSQTLPGLEQLLGVRCAWDGIAVDAIRFCPQPFYPARSIDFLSMGRRSDITHAALVDLSRRREFLYLFDTFSAQYAMNHIEHREQLASKIMRARYFLANKPKVNAPQDRGTQEEIGMRFYEGAAGGAVMVGEAPKCDRYQMHFDWPDATIHLPYHSTEVGSLLDELDRQPARLARIRRDNVVNSLLRHDWLYRWKSVLEMTNLPTLPQFDARLSRLRSLADTVFSSSGKRTIAV